MIRAASQVRGSKRFWDVLRSEIPWSVSLAASGMALQAYATIMLLRTRNPFVVRFPWLEYNKLEDSNSS